MLGQEIIEEDGIDFEKEKPMHGSDVDEVIIVDSDGENHSGEEYPYTIK